MSVSPKPGRRVEGPVLPARVNFSERVESLRRERGYSKETLAARAKLDLGELDELLDGRRKVEVDAIYLLAGALGVEVEDLLDGIRWDPSAEGGSGWTTTGGGQDG
jgi:transcriptional regulator with XRE-family HTH domain